MELKVIKIEGEFVVVELNNGEQKICPSAIFSDTYEIGDIFAVYKKVESRNK